MRKQANNNSVYLERYTFKKYPRYINVNFLEGRQLNKRFRVLKWLWLEFENINEDHVRKLIDEVSQHLIQIRSEYQNLKEKASYFLIWS